MRVFHKLEEVKKIKKPIVTIGTFDGVHLGHQKIIKKIIKEAKKVDGESVLLTFYPHPRMVLYPKNHGLQLLQTQKEKLNSLKETGIDNVVILPFSMEFSRIPAWDFVRDILVNSIGVHTLVIGYDHQFGKNREGNISYLHDVSNSFNFKVIEISAEEVNDVNISSTKIRNALFDGNVEIPKNYLRRPFLISGEVVKGVTEEARGEGERARFAEVEEAAFSADISNRKAAGAKQGLNRSAVIPAAIHTAVS